MKYLYIILLYYILGLGLLGPIRLLTTNLPFYNTNVLFKYYIYLTVPIQVKTIDTVSQKSSLPSSKLSKF